MTAPFQFPNIRQGNTIQDQGDVGAMAQGLAGVLAAMQQQKENEARQQQLQIQAQQQQALEQYYQSQAMLGNRQEDRLGAEAQAKMMGQRQVGGAMQAALGVGQSPTQVPGQPQALAAPQMAQPQRGNITQMGSPGVFQEVLSGAAQALPPQGLAQVFGGVSPENMPAAVQGVADAQKLTPSTTTELPTSAQEFEFLKTLSPEQQSVYWQLIGPKPQGPAAIVNVGGDVEKAYGVEGAKADVAARTEIMGQANAAARAFPSLDEGYRMLQKGTVVAGVGANPILQIHRVLSSMGVKVSKDAVKDTQTASRLLYEGVAAQLAARTFGSGTAVSDKDREAAERMAGVDFSQDLASLKKVTRINVGLNIEKLIGATMQLDEQAQLHPEAQKDLAIRKKGIEAKLYGATGSREKPTKGSIWGKYLDMLGTEAAEDAKDAATSHPENPYR
jgi:hypothetical protein